MTTYDHLTYLAQFFLEQEIFLGEGGGEDRENKTQILSSISFYF